MAPSTSASTMSPSWSLRMPSCAAWRRRGWICTSGAPGSRPGTGRTWASGMAVRSAPMMRPPSSVRVGMSEPTRFTSMVRPAPTPRPNRLDWLVKPKVPGTSACTPRRKVSSAPTSLGSVATAPANTELPSPTKNERSMEGTPPTSASMCGLIWVSICRPMRSNSADE